MRIQREELVAYIYVTDRERPHSAHTVPLGAIGPDELDDVPALRALTLDFDDDGRLIGIEVFDPERWLPPDALEG